jgi:AraC-like DNA-binding protein
LGDEAGWAWFFQGLHQACARRAVPWDRDTLDRLARARAVVDRRFRQDLQLEQLAREACYSRFHFLRLFSRVYAETPHRYLIRRRLDEARRLLGTTEVPVTDVCREVGFASLGSFSRRFREELGEPPIAYRRRVFPGVGLQKRIPACFLRMRA